MTNMTAEDRAKRIVSQVSGKLNKQGAIWVEAHIHQAEAAARLRTLEEVIVVMHANSFFGSTSLISKMMGKNESNCNALLLSDIVFDVRQKTLEKAAQVMDQQANLLTPQTSGWLAFKNAARLIHTLKDNLNA